MSSSSLIKFQTLPYFRKIFGQQGTYNFICECIVDAQHKIVLTFDEKHPKNDPYCLLLMNEDQHALK